MDLWVLFDVHHSERVICTALVQERTHDLFRPHAEFTTWATVEGDQGAFHAGILPRRVQIPYGGPL